MARVCQVTGKRPMLGTMFLTPTIKQDVGFFQTFTHTVFGLNQKTAGLNYV